MIHVFCGKKGSGKTKRIINHANTTAEHCDGSVYFMNCDNSYMYELNHKVRFINTSEYNVVGAYLLLGFLDGLSASNFDLKVIYIDGFLKHMDRDITQLEDLFTKMAAFSEKYKIDIYLSISKDREEIPPFICNFIDE